MYPTFVRLPNPDGSDSGAVALARRNGELLPPGRWLIRAADTTEAVRDLDELPAHWQEYLHKMGEFGRRLDG